MKERGMIFNGEMVRAIIDGRKTQTRRIMKVQPVLNGSFYEVYGAGWVQSMKSVPAIPGHSLANNCPFGLAGDRIWVRETFSTEKFKVHGEELYKNPELQSQWNAWRQATAIQRNSALRISLAASAAVIASGFVALFIVWGAING
ncbi:hypothetical protein JT650_000224 [Escherichia coli]|nr:hypothetical protein [Escherichia coli]